MRVRSFSHVAITVADFNRSVQFYADVFGAPVIAVGDSPHARVRGFFGVDAPNPTCRIGWVRVPGGTIIEIFQFQPNQPPIDTVWNRVGITHFSFDVDDTDAWHRYLVELGVEIVAPPEQSPHGHTFFFVRDPDGNLIELIDTGWKRPLVRQLGWLGGALFRRTLYRKHYRPSIRS